jgi:hypothetical protein
VGTVIERATVYGNGKIVIEDLPPVIEYVLGLDLGKSLDHTALCVLETHTVKDNRKEALKHCRHLQRFKLGTSYPHIVDTVRELCAREPLRSQKPWLAIDGTGVGNAVVDLFRQTPINAHLRPVVIHGGDTVVYEHGIYRVPKRELVGCVQVALQTGRLKIAGELPDVGILTQELQNFQVQISTTTAHDSYEARVGQHDDYVLSVAIALWFAQNGIRYLAMY